MRRAGPEREQESRASSAAQRLGIAAATAQLAARKRTTMKMRLIRLQTRKRPVEDFEEKIGVFFVDAHGRRETNRLPPESAFAEK